MAVTLGNIIIGPGDIYYNVTFSVGVSVALATATGAPGTGTHMGATEADARIQIGFDLYEAMINEYHTSPLAVMQNQWLEFSFTLAEITGATLGIVTNDFGTLTAGVVYWGEIGLPVPATADDPYCYTVPLRTADYFFVLGIYNGYYVNATELAVASMQSLHMMNIPVTMRAHPKTTYTTSGNLGYVDPAKQATL